MCKINNIFCPVLLKSELSLSIFSFNVSEDWDNLIIWESISPKAFPATKLCSLNSFNFSVSLTKFWALSSALLPASETLVEAFSDETLKSDKAFWIFVISFEFKLFLFKSLSFIKL